MLRFEVGPGVGRDCVGLVAICQTALLPAFHTGATFSHNSLTVLSIFSIGNLLFYW